MYFLVKKWTLVCGCGCGEQIGEVEYSGYSYLAAYKAWIQAVATLPKDPRTDNDDRVEFSAWQHGYEEHNLIAESSDISKAS